MVDTLLDPSIPKRRHLFSTKLFLGSGNGKQNDLPCLEPRPLPTHKEIGLLVVSIPAYLDAHEDQLVDSCHPSSSICLDAR